MDTYPVTRDWGLWSDESHRWRTPDGMLTDKPEHAERFLTYTKAEYKRIRLTTPHLFSPKLIKEQR